MRPRCASKPATDWTVLLQALDGSTIIVPGRPGSTGSSIRSPRCSRKRFGAHMLAARYDAFDVEFSGDPPAAGSEDGHAWALAYSYERGDHWRFALEWLRVRSDVPARVDVARRTGARAPNRKLELSARYSLGGSF